MDKNKLLLYFAILLLGISISFYVVRAHFDPKTIGILFFLLVFIPTLINPDIGLIIIIVSILFSPEISVGATALRPVTVRVEDIFLLVIILAWFIRVAFTKDIGSIFKIKLTSPFFSYITICIISTLFAIIFSSRAIHIGHAFFSTLKYLEYFLLFFMVKDNMKSLKQSKILVAVFLSVALITAIHSNVYIGQEIAAGRTFFRTAPPVETRGGGEAGTLGGYLVLMMSIAGGLLLYARSTPIRISLIVLELLMFRGLLYTLSRGSYIAFVPMILALIFFAKKARLVLISMVIGISLLTLVFMPEMVKERILTTVVLKEDIEAAEGTYYLELEESPRMRLESWKIILFDKFPKSPIFGHGVGRYFIDGQIFLTLGEVGLAGLILLLWIWIRLFKMTKDVLDVDLIKEDNFSCGLTIGFLAGFIGLAAHAVSTNTFIIIRIMEPFWFIAAIVLSLPQLLKLEKKKIYE